jgi:SAM-dependent methyltransferase
LSQPLDLPSWGDGTGQDARVPDGPAEEVTAAGAPSPWVVRFAPLIPGAGAVLDLACGRGRHTRFLLQLGLDVVAVDRDLAGIADLLDDPRLEAVEVDLEDGRPFPLAGRHFAAVVVANYLYRPILDDLVAAVRPGGLLLYETFARGHEALGRPRNPAYLLQPGELLRVVRDRLRVVAFEDVVVDQPRPAVVQRIAAVRP